MRDEIGDREQQLAERFLAARPRLVRIAYTILGSRAEAEDVVSEVWPRLAAADAQAAIRDVDAWATVAVGRAALDAYRSARRRRETYVGPWLPEPIVREAVDGRDPADRVTVDASAHEAAVHEFLRAAAGGRIDDLLRVLDPRVVLTSDGGGVVSAARRPVSGADRVARFVLGIADKQPAGSTMLLIDVNGSPGLGVYDGEVLTGVVAFTVDGGVITRVDLIRAPAKLRRRG